METKVMQPKIWTKTRLIGDLYKIRKPLSFDNLNGNILVLKKVKKKQVMFYWHLKVKFFVDNLRLKLYYLRLLK